MKEMGNVERGMATLQGEPIDRMCVYPIVCGVCRRVMSPPPTYKEWERDPKVFGQSFVEGTLFWDLEFAIGLADLAVMAHDMGATVRFDEENTPMVTGHVIHDLEDYDKLLEKQQSVDTKKGRIGRLVEGTDVFTKGLTGKAIPVGFIEGPLLALTQTGGAERIFLDIFMNPDAVHKGVLAMTRLDIDIAKAFGTVEGLPALCYDYLWGNYSCLDDAAYQTFEGCDKYHGAVKKATNDAGLAFVIHNCADMPHVKNQVEYMRPVLYSMGWYPLIKGSPSPVEIIDGGYMNYCPIAGVTDTQLFVRGTPEKMDAAVKGLADDVKLAMSRNQTKFPYILASTCEIPPIPRTKVELITQFVQSGRKYGGMEGVLQ